ncbi:MAG: hypothetical protein WD267_03950 [Balneolales bacterium]
MSVILLLLIFGVILYTLLKFGDWYVLAIMPTLTILMDIIIMHGVGDDAGNSIAFLRGTILIFTFIVLSKRINKYNYNYAIIIIFIFYLFIITTIIGHVDESILIGYDFVARIFITLFSFIVSFSIINNEYQYQKLCMYTMLGGAIFIVYIIIANIFGFGMSLYGKEDDLINHSLISVGNMGGNSFNYLAYTITVLPLIVYNNKKKYIKILAFSSGVLGVIILLLTFRRSALFIILVSVLLHSSMINNKNYLKIFLSVALISLPLLIFSYSFIENIFSIRGESVLQYESISSAGGRTGEIEYVNNIALNSELKNMMFGTSLNTRGVYGNYNRSLHSDISVLIYRFGYISLLLFLSINFIIYNTFSRLKRYSPAKIYVMVFVIFFITNLLMMIPGRMTSLSFNLLVYIHMGAIMGFLLKNKKDVSEKSYLR